MIDIKSLRVGNFINDPEFKYIHSTVVAIDMEDNAVVTNYTDGGKLADKYLPIPLDEEWLIKFGFEEIGEINNYDVTIYNLNNAHVFVSQYEPKEYYINVVRWGIEARLQPHIKYFCFS